MAQACAALLPAALTPEASASAALLPAASAAVSRPSVTINGLLAPRRSRPADLDVVTCWTAGACSVSMPAGTTMELGSSTMAVVPP
jgi:hypothetical protein